MCLFCDRELGGEESTSDTGAGKHPGGEVSLQEGAAREHPQAETGCAGVSAHPTQLLGNLG